MGLHCVAGSDAHGSHNAGKAGIASKERIRTNEDLVRVLKSGCYTVLKNDCN